MASVAITGVSTGIGYATAKLFAKEGITVFGSVRSQADADRIQKDLGQHFQPLILDILEEDKVRKAASRVREQLNGKTLSGLINNAGIAVQGALMNMPIKEFQKQLDVNLTAQMIVTQSFLPLLGVDKELVGNPGKIINISSISGKHAYPFMGAYAASKHGLEAFSESLRRELMLFGIDVIIVAPGAIKTDIWNKARNTPLPSELKNSIYHQAAHAFKEYVLNDAEKFGLQPATIAELLLRIMRSPRPKTRYAPIPQKILSWTIPNLLPKRFIDWKIAKKFLLNK